MYLLDRYTFFLYKFCKEKGSFLIFILVHGIIFLGDWMFRYYLALMIGRVLVFLLSLFYKKGTQVPGKVALFLCPHFLSYVKKPKTIIAVTGTNGKTTVCNMIVDLFLKYDFSIVHNRNGSNLMDGIASAFLKASGKEDYAVLEVDERSFIRVCSYLTFDYLIVTNLFRDSMRRNAHPEYIRNIIDGSIAPSTTLILNADDLISSEIGDKNKKIFFGIDPMEKIIQKETNLAHDLMICPKCNHLLIYDSIFYHHIGKSHCSNCSFTSFLPDYHVTEMDLIDKKIVIRNFNKTSVYPMVAEGLFNVYNELAVITLFSELKFPRASLSKFLKEIHITESRFTKTEKNNIEVITHMTKSQNSIACSTVFQYICGLSTKRAIILILDDIFDAKKSSETICWLYDTDFEFLKQDSIAQIIIGGVRNKDYYVRLLLAGVEKKKIFCVEKELETPSVLDLSSIEQVFILHDPYTFDLAKKVREKVLERIED